MHVSCLEYKDFQDVRDSNLEFHIFYEFHYYLIMFFCDCNAFHNIRKEFNFAGETKFKTEEMKKEKIPG